MHRYYSEIQKYNMRIFLTIALIALSNQVFGDELLNEAPKSENSTESSSLKDLKVDGANSSEKSNQLIQAINSSLVSLNTRLASLETKVSNMDENTAAEQRQATQKRLQENKAKLRTLSNNVKTIEDELAELTYEYKRAVGKIGTVASNDRQSKTVDGKEVGGSTGSSGAKNTTELPTGPLTTTMPLDGPTAASLNTTTISPAENQTVKAVPVVKLNIDDKPQKVESTTLEASQEIETTTESVQEDQTASSGSTE